MSAGVIPHLTIFGMPKYAPHLFGLVFERAKYGQLGCPRKDIAKSSSDALILCQ